jgi:hypothetical protein
MTVFIVMVYVCTAATGNFHCQWQSEPQPRIHFTMGACLQDKPPHATCQPVLMRP